MAPAGEEDLRDLIVRLAERSVDVIYRYRLGPDPGFDYISPAIERLTGYTPEEYYADPQLSIRTIHPDDREWAEGAIHSPLEHAGRATVRLIHKDGGVVWVERSNRVVSDEAGRPVAVEGVSREISDRLTVAKELRDREATARALFDETGLPMVLVDDERRFVDGNPAACELFAVARERLPGHRLDDFTSDEDGVRLVELWAAFRERGALSRNYRLLRPDGSIREIVFTAADVRPGLHLAVLGDAAERGPLEELGQSQKMEAMGRLAGGVAHDFNNQLAAIRLYCDLVLGHVDDPERVRREVEGIVRVADLASQLTAQLLAFGRKQVMQARPLDVNLVVARAELMLRRLLGSGVVLETELSPGLAPVDADPGQLERVIVNLALNARDAMTDGGTLTILTANVERESEPSVLLQVSDTGVGMDEATSARLFEPFFTTKGPGEGTGLGLATAHGVVTQSGGTIEVESEPGRGSTFRIHLPRSETAVEARLSEVDALAPAGGSETVLLVEDVEAVRAVTAEMLEDAGYRVLAAAHGAEALQLAGELERRLDAVVTDVLMPGMGGPEVVERLRERFPDLPVVFMSGYREEEAISATQRSAPTAFVQKPFLTEELARTLRAVLDVER